MRPYYLLDTNIVCEASKQNPNPFVMEKLRAHGANSAISTITIAEFWKGVQLLPEGHRKNNYIDFYNDEVLPLYTKIDFDDHAAFIYGDYEAQEEKHGRTRQKLDMLIAATAIANNMILVTRNTEDFEGIPNLMLENWFEE